MDSRESTHNDRVHGCLHSLSKPSHASIDITSLALVKKATYFRPILTFALRKAVQRFLQI